MCIRDSTSTTQVDLATISSLSLAAGTPITARFLGYKTTGAASQAFFGLKVNSTAVCNANGTDYWAVFSATNSAMALYAICDFIANPSDGTYHILRRFEAFRSALTSDGSGVSGTSLTNSIPAATVTDVIVLGKTNSASQTLKLNYFHVYSYAVA